MCHENDAIMHEPQASALCNQVHYCIIRVCHIIRKSYGFVGGGEVGSAVGGGGGELSLRSPLR